VNGTKNQSIIDQIIAKSSISTVVVVVVDAETTTMYEYRNLTSNIKLQTTKIDSCVIPAIVQNTVDT